ncbi:hypothetical protein [Candidatus Erwinia dacicola]|uniref:Uncharacterized protein n=1 Tax=Candidatus Erwinia dacicola TaxID=252393 RepID=A0A328TIS0_9GAMM|nr:hypothetical protein [Candidatus Erwinia dacicola]RAP70517.1 hypothetical protein ACZ87_02680 [Candidatus Erwinia dacicola]
MADHSMTFSEIYRNGYRDRQYNTRLGMLDLRYGCAPLLLRFT